MALMTIGGFRAARLPGQATSGRAAMYITQTLNHYGVVLCVIPNFIPSKACVVPIIKEHCLSNDQHSSTLVDLDSLIVHLCQILSIEEPGVGGVSYSCCIAVQHEVTTLIHSMVHKDIICDVWRNYEKEGGTRREVGRDRKTYIGLP